MKFICPRCGETWIAPECLLPFIRPIDVAGVQAVCKNCSDVPKGLQKDYLCDRQKHGRSKTNS